MKKDHLVDVESSEAAADSNGIQPDSVTGAGRRRVLQGVAAVAPAILTLRSGALMAATSCTGIRGYVSEGVWPNPGDWCAKDSDVTYCEGSSNKVESVSDVKKAKPCSEFGNINNRNYCNDNTTTGYGCPGKPGKHNVVISNAAYQSLIGG